MEGSRISLDLSHYYSDFRKKTYVYIDFTRHKKIHEVESHIQKLLQVKGGISLVVDEHFLPHGESIAVLNENDVVKVMPTQGIEEFPIEEIIFPQSSGKKKRKKSIDTTPMVLDVESTSNKHLKTPMYNGFKSSNCVVKEQDSIAPKKSEYDNHVLKGSGKKKQKKSKYTQNGTEHNVFNDNVDIPENKKKHSRHNSDDVYMKVSVYEEKCNDENYVATQSSNECEVNKNVTCAPYYNSVNTPNNSKDIKEEKEEVISIDACISNEAKVVQSPNKVCVDIANMKQINTNHKRFRSNDSSCSDIVTSNTDISIVEQEKELSMHSVKKRRRRHKKKTSLPAIIVDETTSVQDGFITPAITTIPKHIKFEDSGGENETVINVDNINNLPRSIPEKSVTPEKENLRSEICHVQTLAVNNIGLEKRNSPLVFHCHKTPTNKISTMNVYDSEIDYAKQPTLQGTPREEDIIAFKLLKLGSDYTPEVSRFITGKVLSFSEEDTAVKLQILRGHNELKEPQGKFSLCDEEQAESILPNETILNFKDLLEVKILFP